MNIHTIILHKKIHLYSQSQNHTTIKNALLKQFISLPAHKLCYLNIHIYIQQILFKKIYERFNPKLPPIFPIIEYTYTINSREVQETFYHVRLHTEICER